MPHRFSVSKETSRVTSSRAAFRNRTLRADLRNICSTESLPFEVKRLNCRDYLASEGCLCGQMQGQTDS